MKKREITLAQANALTQARYNYTVVEKRAVYQIIKEIRSRFIERDDGQKDLFNDLIIHIKTSDLLSNDVQLREVYTSLKSLRRKSIWIEDNDRVLELGYINYFEHKKRETHVEVQISHKILPYLVQLAKEFTTYSLTVAISLKTKYSQRFYEYCSQYKSIGFFYVSIEELRKKLLLENSYSRYALMKSKIIDTAQKELKNLYEAGQCDLCFNYSEDKSGRTVLGLKIAVITKDKQQIALKAEDCLHYVKKWLNEWFLTARKPKNKAWVDGVINHLLKNTEQIPKLYEKLNRMQLKDPASNFAPLARHIIEEDYLN